MNYGKNGVRRAEELSQASAARIGNAIGVTALRGLLFLLIAVVVSGICLAAGAYQGVIQAAPDITDANIMPLGNASFILDAEGNQTQKLSSVEGNRVSVSLDQIPLDMQHAIVAIEDSRFYEHDGVDPHGMVRALGRFVSSGFRTSEGASTITQQLLKNNVFLGWTNESRIEQISRKLQEQYLAVQLEESLRKAGQDPKRVILENYLNTVNFGAGAYGVQTAAQTYFGKDAKDLTLSESAVLAAIVQNPYHHNPKLFPEDNAKRMQTVLSYMKKQGYITEEAYQEAVNDDVYDRIAAHEDAASQQVQVYSYFVDQTIEQVKRDLMAQKGYTEDQAENAVYSGGLQIYSTEDPQIQAIMEEEFANPENMPPETQVRLNWALTVRKPDGNLENYSAEQLAAWFVKNGQEDFDRYFDSEAAAQAAVDEYKAAVVPADNKVVAERMECVPQPQACMTVIDQKTGHVVGIVGALGEKTGSLTLNRATEALRQPGSTFKIPSTYGPALELGRISLATPETDDVASYSDGTQVNNADDAHHGTMSVRRAIMESNNVIAFKVLSQLSPQVGFNYLQKLGISTLDETYDMTAGLALGGITKGVSDVELTAAYAAIANGGEYQRPIFYTKVTDRLGNIILQNKTQKNRVFKATTCYLLTSAMEDVVKSGTGTRYQLSNGQTVAGKTGTTDKYVDLQFVGFTPYYTAGIWTGYDTSKSLSEADRNYIGNLWTAVMNRVHEDLPAEAFTAPEGIQKLDVCALSGNLAGVGCPVISEYFDAGNAPIETCALHAANVAPSAAPTQGADQNGEEGGESGQEGEGDSYEEEPGYDDPTGGDETGGEEAGGEEYYVE